MVVVVASEDTDVFLLWRLSALFRHPCMPSVERRPERDMLVFPVWREP